MKVRKYYVEFAACNGKTCFVGSGPRGYPTVRSAARLFNTVEAAQDAADDISDRYLLKGALPIILGRVVYEVDNAGITLPGLHTHATN